MLERTVQSGTEVIVKGAYILVEPMGVTEYERETGCDYQVTNGAFPLQGLTRLSMV